MESLVICGVPVVAERTETDDGRSLLCVAVQPVDGPWTEVSILLDGRGGVERLMTRYGREILDRP